MKELKDDHSASMDRLLAGVLKARAGAAPPGPCLDAETMAAWTDGALDASERAIAEAHAAECGRCQVLLAAMVRTSPPAAEAPSWWRMPAFRWLVPLTAAATALALWVAVPNRAPVQVSDGGVPAVDQAAPTDQALAADRAASADRTAPAQAPARPTGSAAEPRADLQAKAADNEPAPATRERQDSAALDKQTARATQQTPNALSEAIAVAPATSPSVTTASPTSPSVTTPSPSAAPAEARALGAARVSTFANATQVVIVSSNPATRFRLLPGGGVQRSADGGATWRTEGTGATETLTAGSSPSPSVCWLIGPSGSVFLSTDGRSWRRLTFPDTEDLRAVSATDNENATVTTVSGRSFVTTDAGQTWLRNPDL